MEEITQVLEHPQEIVPITALSKVQTAEQQKSNTDLLSKTICLSVKISALGIRKKVSSQLIESDANKDLLYVAKDLVESETYKKIKKLDGEVRVFIRSICLPSPMFKSGVYLLPIPCIEEADNKLEEFKIKRHELVQQFILEYPALKESAETQLNSLFNPLDYPEIGKIAQAFSMDTRYVTFSTPGKLKEISLTIYQREVDKAQKDVEAAANEIKNALRCAMADFVDHLTERLETKFDGEKKIFHVSTITNFTSFLDSFQQRNIVGDEDLRVLVEDAKMILGGIEPKSLRTNDELREQLSTKFEVIKEQLDTMLIDRPRRKFKIRDEVSEIKEEE